jgi:hypothetical protein
LRPARFSTSQHRSFAVTRIERRDNHLRHLPQSFYKLDETALFRRFGTTILAEDTGIFLGNVVGFPSQRDRVRIFEPLDSESSVVELVAGP